MAWFLNLFFPKRCIFCRGFLGKHEDFMCEKCQKNLPHATGKSVFVKGKFFDKTVSPFYYSDMVRSSILRYKFSNREFYCEKYGPMLAECIKKELDVDFDVITSVVSSKMRRRKRGYDPAVSLAKQVANALGIDYEKLIIKTRSTKPQSQIRDKAQRRANIAGSFKLSRGVDGLRVLVIDDIITTGATLEECSKELMLGGAARVCCATFAQTDLRYKQKKGAKDI